MFRRSGVRVAPADDLPTAQAVPLQQTNSMGMMMPGQLVTTPQGQFVVTPQGLVPAGQQQMMMGQPMMMGGQPMMMQQPMMMMPMPQQRSAMDQFASGAQSSFADMTASGNRFKAQTNGFNAGGHMDASGQVKLGAGGALPPGVHGAPPQQHMQAHAPVFGGKAPDTSHALAALNGKQYLAIRQRFELAEAVAAQLGCGECEMVSAARGARRGARGARREARHP